MREKGKNREFWLKTHNVAANSWGKGESEMARVSLFLCLDLE
jgi:hypothetical protein